VPYPRFQGDEDFDRRIIEGLRRREPSIDFIRAKEAGTLGLPDPEVLQIAADAVRILVSHDRNTMPGHFYRFVATSPSPGLLIVKKEVEMALAIEELLLLWAASGPEEWLNRIRFVPLSAGA